MDKYRNKRDFSYAEQGLDMNFQNQMMEVVGVIIHHIYQKMEQVSI